VTDTRPFIAQKEAAQAEKRAKQASKKAIEWHKKSQEASTDEEVSKAKEKAKMYAERAVAACKDAHRSLTECQIAVNYAKQNMEHSRLPNVDIKRYLNSIYKAEMDAMTMYLSAVYHAESSLHILGVQHKGLMELV